MNRWLGIIALMITWSAGTGPSHSAEIERVDRENCSYRLTGEIVPGDLERLRASGIRWGDTLCLSSPGGSYQTGLDMAQFLLDEHIETVVDDGDSCFSSCANLFMAGNMQEENLLLPRRRMHYRAALGFHAPYLLPQNGQFSGEIVRQAYAEGLNAVASMLALGSDLYGDGVFPKELVIELLRMGPDQMYLIDTVGKARLMNIEILGMPKVSLNLRTLCNICNNYHSMRNKSFTSACEGDLSKKVKVKQTSKSTAFFRFPEFGGEGAYDCVMRISMGRNRVITEAKLYTGLALPEESKFADYEFIEPSDYLAYHRNTLIGSMRKAP